MHLVIRIQHMNHERILLYLYIAITTTGELIKTRNSSEIVIRSENHSTNIVSGRIYATGKIYTSNWLNPFSSISRRDVHLTYQRNACESFVMGMETCFTFSSFIFFSISFIVFYCCYIIFFNNNNNNGICNGSRTPR